MTMTAAVARVNLGYWVADCPAEWCTGAEHYGGRLNGLGMLELGGLTDTGFTCKTCGLQCPAEWPAQSDRVEIERLLMERPNPRTRNWEPHELPFDLLRENIAHGVLPPAALEALTRPLQLGEGAGETPRVSEALSVGDVTALLGQPLRALTGGR